MGSSFFIGEIMFTIIPIIVTMGFVFVFGSIIYNAINVAKDKRKPIIPVNAKVVGKRNRVRRTSGHNHGDGMHSSGRTYNDYYVTFEMENGERIEFEIPDHKVGLIVEGDEGTLKFQGNLFVDFERSF